MRDQHFKASGNITSHYKQIRRSTSFGDRGTISGKGDTFLLRMNGGDTNNTAVSVTNRMKSAIRSAGFKNMIMGIIIFQSHDKKIITMKILKEQQTTALLTMTRVTILMLTMVMGVSLQKVKENTQ